MDEMDGMDGWSEEVRDCLEDVFPDLECLMYEVRNCIRGRYTHANTNEELAEYVQSLADELGSVADDLPDCEDNSTLEEVE